MRFLSFTVLLGASGWAWSTAANEAHDWLGRLDNAERQQSYQGTFVYERSGSFSTHRIWQQVAAGGSVWERLLQLDGPAQEIVRVDGRIHCASDGLSEQVVDGQHWPARLFDVEALARWYEMRVLGASRVAGREAVVLALLPRDQHRYGVELHLDRETGLALKSLLLNEKGQMLERFQFTQLELTSAQGDGAVRPSANCGPVRHVPSDASVAEQWRFDWLPPGFALNGVTLRRGADSDVAVACLMYGDGLARFSVFLEPLQGEGAVLDARSQLGPTVAVSRRLSAVQGDVMVTVVGEIPLGTAERIALSTRPAQSQVTP